MINVNYFAIVASTVVSMVLGALWYGPLFGKKWLAFSGITEEVKNKAKAKGMSKSFGLMFLGAFLMNYVLAHAIVFANAYLETEGVASGLVGGFWNWLGFIAPVTMGVVLWEGKSWGLWLINSGYYLVALSV